MPTYDPITLLAARARVVLPDGTEALREVLRIESRRTIELRPAAGPGLASLDLQHDLAIVTIAGGPLTEVELEWVVVANGPLPFDAWALCPGRCNAEACVLGAFGMLAIPDLTARNPAMDPALLMPGRYLLRASVSDGSMVLRLGVSSESALLRAAG
ncbi:MAG: hypothetical protein FJ260_00635 [Planctomycetes bacterium]|nr:hypothetical protein [Planctomycetota bacterium]